MLWIVLDGMQSEPPTMYMATRMSFHFLRNSRNDFLGKKEKFTDIRG